MAEIKNFKASGNVWRVDIIESERGWGQKIDETKYFDSKESAMQFVAEYNSTNDYSNGVPDWYMQACSPRMIC